MASFKALIVSLLLAVGLVAQPIPQTGDPDANAQNQFTLNDTATPGNEVGTVTKSNMDVWDIVYPDGTAHALWRKQLPANDNYTGDGWVELNTDGSPTGYAFFFFKNWNGDWRWEKRAVTVDKSQNITSIGSSAGFGPVV